MENVDSLPTLRTLMLRRFGASVVGALVIVCALLIGAIFILGSVAEDNTVSAIDRQARSHVLLSAGALGDAVNRKFQNIEDGVVLAQANLVFQFMSVEDDFTLMPIGGDIEASNIPPSKMEPIDRLEGVSAMLERSVYHMPSGAEDGLDSSSTMTKSVVVDGVVQPRTARTEQLMSGTLNYIYNGLWEDHPSVVQMYVGFESGLFRSYPGAPRASASYDPRLRPWYEAADQQGSGIVHAAPYPDANGAGWMISPSVLIRDGSSRFGVAAADIKIDDIQHEILATPGASLLRIDGVVVASTYWDTTVTPGPEDEAPVIWDLASHYSRSFLSELTDTSAGLAARVFDVDAEDGTALFIARAFVPPTLEDTDLSQPRYVLLVELNADNELAVADGVSERFSDSSVGLSIIAVVLSVLSVVVVTAVVSALANSVTAPLKQVRKLSRAVTNNAAGDLGRGLRVSELDASASGPACWRGDDEVKQFVGEVKKLMQGLSSKSAGKSISTNQGKMAPNPFRAHTAPWSSSLDTIGGVVVDADGGGDSRRGGAGGAGGAESK